MGVTTGKERYILRVISRGRESGDASRKMNTYNFSFLIMLDLYVGVRRSLRADPKKWNKLNWENFEKAQHLQKPLEIRNGVEKKLIESK